MSKPKLFIHHCAKNSYPHKNFRKLCGCDLLGRWRKAGCNVLLFPVVLSMKGKKTMQKGRREGALFTIKALFTRACTFFPTAYIFLPGFTIMWTGFFITTQPKMRSRWANSLESFRLGRLRVYEYDILRKRFFAYCRKIFNPESFIVLFST